MPTLEDFLHHPIETLEKALHLRKEIDSLQKRLGELFGSTPPAFAGNPIYSEAKPGRGRPKGKKMSAQAKAKIAAAQRARWAKSKGGESAVAAPGPAIKSKKKKGGMSAAGRARIAAAQKARWARVKKAKI